MLYNFKSYAKIILKTFKAEKVANHLKSSYISEIY